MDKIVYRNDDGQVIKGYKFNVLVKDGDYFLTDLTIYADGLIYCLGLIDLLKLKELLYSGKLALKLPVNSRILIPNIGYVISLETDFSGYSDDRFIEIIQEKIKELKVEINSRAIVFQRFKECLLESNDFNIESLKSSWGLLSEEDKLTFDSNYFDPIKELIKTKEIWSSGKRESLLKEYFEGEWLEVK